MTIRPGCEWGIEVATPTGPWRIGGDRALLEEAQSTDPRPCALDSGELFRELGSPASPIGSERCRLLNVDALSVSLVDRTGRRHAVMTTRVVVRRSWARGGLFLGRLRVISNYGRYLGATFSPRSHPNDGKAELLDVVSAAPRVRVLAWSRMRASTFSSTENIRVSQIISFSHEVRPGECVVVNGRTYRRLERLQCDVVPDFALVHVGAM